MHTDMKDTPELTDRQRQLLRSLLSSKGVIQYAPIGNPAFHLTTKNLKQPVRKQTVEVLEKQGYITRTQINGFLFEYSLTEKAEALNQ